MKKGQPIVEIDGAIEDSLTLILYLIADGKD